MNRAACLVAFNENNEILVVTRRNSHMVGLPGGKVDPNESEEEALIREIKEETGIFLTKDEIIPLYVDLIEPGADGKGFWTTAYLCERTDLDPEELEVGITPLWLSISEFLDIERNAFINYNIAVLTSLEKIKDRSLFV